MTTQKKTPRIAKAQYNARGCKRFWSDNGWIFPTKKEKEQIEKNINEDGRD